ncbi:176_t:CDS:1, partial [Acaulospora colombiana]
LVSKSRSTKDMIQIFVKTINGKTHVIRVATDETVADIKDRVQKIDGSPVSRQRLLYTGKQLCDEMTLADYEVQRDSTLHVNLRLRGGGNIFSIFSDDPFCGSSSKKKASSFSTSTNNQQHYYSPVTPSQNSFYTPTTYKSSYNSSQYSSVTHANKTASTNRYSNNTSSLYLNSHSLSGSTTSQSPYTSRVTSSTLSTSTRNSTSSHANKTVLTLTPPQSPTQNSVGLRTNRTISSCSHVNKTSSTLTPPQSPARSSVRTISPTSTATRSSSNHRSTPTTNTYTTSHNSLNSSGTLRLHNSSVHNSGISRVTKTAPHLTPTATKNIRSSSNLANSGSISLNVVPHHSVALTKSLTLDYGISRTTNSQWYMVKLYLALPSDLFAPQYDYDFTYELDDQELHTRGHKIYRRPYGFMRFALNVKDKYPGGNAWLGDRDKRRGTTTIPKEWL